jgi:hypothetical protein
MAAQAARRRPDHLADRPSEARITWRTVRPRPSRHAAWSQPVAANVPDVEGQPAAGSVPGFEGQPAAALDHARRVER